MSNPTKTTPYPRRQQAGSTAATPWRRVSFKGSLAALGAAVLLAPAPAYAADEALETVTVQYQSVERERILDGIVEAVNHSTMSAQVSARVTAIHFDVDDHVEQGELIIEFDDTEYQARLREAMARRESAEAERVAAKAHFDRIADLYERRTTSRAEYDQARADLGSAQAALAAAEAVIAQIRQQLEYTRVVAPYSGIVTERHIEIGETANPGTPLMSGFSLDRLRAVVHFPQRLLSTFRDYRRAQVVVPGTAGERIDSEAITIFPYAEQGTSTIPVRVLLPEDTSVLFPGMLVKVAFPMGNRLRLAVPERALVYRSEVVGVYVVDDTGEVGFRHVRTGDTASDGTVEILAGLDDGERVALSPARAAAALKAQRTGS